MLNFRQDDDDLRRRRKHETTATYVHDTYAKGAYFAPIRRQLREIILSQSIPSTPSVSQQGVPQLSFQVYAKSMFDCLFLFTRNGVGKTESNVLFTFPQNSEQPPHHHLSLIQPFTKCKGVWRSWRALKT